MAAPDGTMAVAQSSFGGLALAKGGKRNFFFNWMLMGFGIRKRFSRGFQAYIRKCLRKPFVNGEAVCKGFPQPDIL